MYSTCLFCNQSLGSNEVVDAFPVGRRLAFDADKGRLWVVCRRCERWNLSPLEERWEAVDTCARLFHDTRMRVSTENIGLARLREGLELVRIGQPLLPEFAAWRYGDQFGRRRRRALAWSAGALVAGGAAIAGSVTGMMSGVLIPQLGNLASLYSYTRTVVRVQTENGELLKLKQGDIEHSMFVPPLDDEGWRVVIGMRVGRKPASTAKVFHGEDGERIASRILPALNRMGGSAASVKEAVKYLEKYGGPEGFLRSDLLDPRASGWRLAAQRGRNAVRVRGPGGEPALHMSALSKPVRLAVEMALHEEQERRALQGELEALEIAWQEAERIASIADDLLLPKGTDSFLQRHTGSGKDPSADDANNPRGPRVS